MCKEQIRQKTIAGLRHMAVIGVLTSFCNCAMHLQLAVIGSILQLLIYRSV